MNCHILAKCSSPKRIKSLLLVFRSIRVGFPKANLFVYGNNLDPRIIPHLFKAMDRKGCQYRNINLLPKGEWIEKLIQSERAPFWICDTDMVFFDSVEDWKFDLFGGRYEPEFIEPWTQTQHMARLHPSLMYFNPVKLRQTIRGWPGKHDFFSSMQMNLFRWHWVPELGCRLKFYDVCAGLHHAFMGTAFSENQNEAFTHLFCGSYAHLSDTYKEHRAMQEFAFETPFLTKGLWKVQLAWYKEHQYDKPTRNGQTNLHQIVQRKPRSPAMDTVGETVCP